MNVGAYSFKIENKKYEPFPYVFYSLKQYMSQQFSLFLLVTFTHVATGSLSLCLANGKYDYLHERCGEMSIFFLRVRRCQNVAFRNFLLLGSDWTYED